MKNPRYEFGMALTAVAMMCSVGAGRCAQAQVITQTETLGSTAVDFNGVALTPNINKFNAALGTLTDVDITWTVTAFELGTVTTAGTATQTFTLKLDTSVNLSEQPNGAGSLANPNLDSQQTFTNLPPSTPMTFGSFTPSATEGPTVLSDAATKSFFTGAGTLNLFATSSTTQLNVGGSNVRWSLIDNVSGTATIVYRYQPASAVPEPGNIALLAGLSVSSLLAIRRLRRRS